jgi:hypothetical protein
MRTNRIGLEPRRQPGGPEVLHPWLIQELFRAMEAHIRAGEVIREQGRLFSIRGGYTRAVKDYYWVLSSIWSRRGLTGKRSFYLCLGRGYKQLLLGPVWKLKS